MSTEEIDGRNTEQADSELIVNPELLPEDIEELEARADTQVEFAKSIDVNEVTVRNWKKENEYTPNPYTTAKIISEWGSPSRFDGFEVGTYTYESDGFKTGWTVFGNGEDVIEKIQQVKQSLLGESA